MGKKLKAGGDTMGILIGVVVVGFIGIAVIVIGLAAYGVLTYNSFVTLRERVLNGRAQIAAQIESRWDAITNLISATKQYESHEAGVLENITAQRSSLGRDSSVADLEENDAQLNNVVGRLIAISEAYPELKASEVYKSTMESVNKFEDNVRHARMIYNDVVTQFNRKVKSFPSSLLAKIFKFTTEPYFEQTEQKAEMPTWD